MGMRDLFLLMRAIWHDNMRMMMASSRGLIEHGGLGGGLVIIQ